MFGSGENAATSVKALQRGASKKLAQREQLQARLAQLETEESEAQQQLEAAEAKVEEQAAAIRLGEAEADSLSALDREAEEAQRSLRGFAGARAELERRAEAIEAQLLELEGPAHGLLRQLVTEQLAAADHAIGEVLDQLGAEIARLHALRARVPATLRARVDAVIRKREVEVAGTPFVHHHPSGLRIGGQDANESFDAEKKRLDSLFDPARALVDQLEAATYEVRKRLEKKRAEAAQVAESQRRAGVYTVLPDGRQVPLASREAQEHHERIRAEEREADEEKRQEERDREAAARRKRRWSEHPPPTIREGAA